MSAVVLNPWMDYFKDIVARSRSRDASCHAEADALSNDLDDGCSSSQASEG